MTSALGGEQTVPRVVPMLLAATPRDVEMSRELSVGKIERKSCAVSSTLEEPCTLTVFNSRKLSAQPCWVITTLAAYISFKPSLSHRMFIRPLIGLVFNPAFCLATFFARKA